MSKEWVKRLKVGDAVIVQTDSLDRVMRVERITPTGRIVVGGTTFTPDGWLYGSGYWSASLCEATPEAIDSIRKNKKITSVFKLIKDTKSITYEQAIEIEKILTVLQEVNHE